MVFRHRIDLVTAPKPINLGPIYKVRAGSYRLLLYGTAGRSECERESCSTARPDAASVSESPLSLLDGT